MATPRYFIDGDPVNDRGDWRQQLVPAPASRQVEAFPGDGNLYVAKGRSAPPTILVTGYLEADDHAELHELLVAYIEMRDDVELHGIEIYGSAWSNLDLFDFRVAGRARGYAREGQSGIAQPVQFLWQQVIKGGA